jgi:putative nucleotidyltransferase with HDIG domain
VESAQEHARRTLARISQTGELPTPNAVVSAALATIQDPDADIAAVCDVVRRDVAITARVLKLANSAMYARHRPFEGLQDAVTAVGLRVLQDMLLTVSLRAHFRAKGPAIQALWDHALATALTAQEIVRFFGAIRPATVFLPALFHDVGRLALFTSDPAAFAPGSKLVTGTAAARMTAERERFGFDHTEASAALAIHWGLPKEMTDALRHHHGPAPDATEPDVLAALLHAADVIVYTYGVGAPASPETAGTCSDIAPEDQAAAAERARKAFDEQRRLFE